MGRLGKNITNMGNLMFLNMLCWLKHHFNVKTWVNKNWLVAWSCIIRLIINSIVVNPVKHYPQFCQKRLGFETSPNDIFTAGLPHFWWCLNNIPSKPPVNRLQFWGLNIESSLISVTARKAISSPRLFEPPKTEKPSVQNAQKIRKDGQVTKRQLSECENSLVGYLNACIWLYDSI